MVQRIWKKIRGIMSAVVLSLMICVQFIPVEVYAADNNLSDVQFTTGKYGVNCLTASNWEIGGSRTQNLTQNVILDSAARKRADQGELKITASVRVGANGSRTNTRKLEIKFFDKNGTQLGSTQKNESDSYSVSHHWNTLTLTDKTIPKNTYRIQYYVYNHIGVIGDLEIQNCSLIVKDTTSPKVVNISATTDDGRAWNQPHPAGTKVTYTLHFSERVSANVDLANDKGAPWIEPYSPGVSVGAIAPASDGSATTLSYVYTIPSGGNVISDDHIIALKGISAFTATDDAGNATTVGMTEEDVKKINSNLASGGTLRMDNRPPELADITSEGFSKDTILKEGDTIKLHLKFHENIKVSGETPSVILSNGERAEYIPTATTTNLASFTYTIGAGEDVNDLSISGFNLSGVVDGVNQKSVSSTKYAEFTEAHKDYMAAYGVDIDTTAPEMMLPDFKENWIGKTDMVSVSVSDNVKEGIQGSGVKTVKYAWSQSNSGTPSNFTDLLDSGTGNFSIPAPSTGGSWYLWIKSEDNAGNISAPVCSIGTARFDLTPPEIRLTKIEADGKVVDVTVSFSDTESGIALRKYQWFNEKNELVNSGFLSENEQPQPPAQNGNYRLEISAKDVAGNESIFSQEVCVCLTVPNVSITRNSQGYQKSHTFSVICSDAASTICLVEYQWKLINEPILDADWAIASETETGYVFSSPQNKNGEWRLYIRATNAAGNKTVEYASCLLDNTAPSIMMLPDGNEGNEGKTSYDVTVTVDDAVTSKNEIVVEYAVSSHADASKVTAWTEVTDPTAISVNVSPREETLYLHVKAVDKVGNAATITSRAFVADTISPTGTIALASGKSVTNSNVVNLEFSATDDYADFENMKVQFSVDEKDWSSWEVLTKNKTVTFEETEKEHVIKVRFCDEAGNVSEPVSVTVTYDITPPAITLAYSCTERTNQDVTVTARIPDGTFLTADRFEFTANGSYTFRAQDEAGNISENIARVTWIDKTSPEFTLSSDEADGNPHKTAAFTVSSEATDLEGYFYRIYQGEAPSGEWEQRSSGTQQFPILPDGTYTVEVYAVDDLGNQSTSKKLTVILDNTPPTAAISYLPDSRTSENVIAILTPQDEHRVIVTKPSDGSFAYTFTENGSYIFEFEDAAGNKGSMVAKVDWIDRTLPRLKTTIKDSDGNVISSGQWVNKPVRVSLERTHAAQVYDKLTFNGKDILGDRIEEVEGIDLVPNEGDTYRVTCYGVLEYQITDKETNLTSSGSLVLAVDTEKPFCGDENIVYSSKSWINQDVTVLIQPKDDLSQSITYLRKDGDNYIEVASANSHVFTENGSHIFYFKDQAGNIGSKEVTVDWIDKESPVATVVYTTEDGSAYAPDNWTNQSVKAELNFTNDTGSPVTMTEGETWYLFETNGSHTFTYEDASGNHGSTTVTIDQIDKVAPTGYMTAKIGDGTGQEIELTRVGWTNQDVTITLHAYDDSSGTADMSHTFTKNGTHTFLLKDQAGNQTEYTCTMDYIDKEAPEINLTYSPGNVTKTPFAVYVNASSKERVQWEGNISSWKFKDNGSHIFKAVDRAGNSTEVTAQVDWISPDLPEVELVYSPEIMKDEKPAAIREDVQVELKATDPNAAVRVLNNGQSRFYTFQENGSFTFRYTDAKGEKVGTVTATVNCIDKEGPKLTAQADRTELGKEPVKVTVMADEAVTWPNGMTVLDEKTATMEFTENTAVQLWAEDVLGNRGYVQIRIDCIDQTPPEILMENTVDCIPLGQAFDPYEGVTVKDEHPADTPLSILGTVQTDRVGDYTLIYTALDRAGNNTTIKREVNVYDPEQFHVQINGQLYLGQTICIAPSGNEVELIHAEGKVSVKLLPGKVLMGDFKTKGNQIAEPLLDGSYTFPGIGYYTLLIQDQERATELVQLFVAQ